MSARDTAKKRAGPGRTDPTTHHRHHNGRNAQQERHSRKCTGSETSRATRPDPWGQLTRFMAEYSHCLTTGPVPEPGSDEFHQLDRDDPRRFDSIVRWALLGLSQHLVGWRDEAWEAEYERRRAEASKDVRAAARWSAPRKRWLPVHDEWAAQLEGEATRGGDR